MKIANAETLTTLGLTLDGVPGPFAAVITHVSGMSLLVSRMVIYDKEVKPVYKIDRADAPVSMTDILVTLENWAYAIEVSAANTAESNYYAEKSGL